MIHSLHIFLLFCIMTECAASSSCLSSKFISHISVVRSYVESIKHYLPNCEEDQDLKKPLASLVRHQKRIIDDINRIDAIIESKCMTTFTQFKESAIRLTFFCCR